MCPHQSPIIDRRSFDGHTPETCFKLIDVQRIVDDVKQELVAGAVRMTAIEASIASLVSIIENNAAAHDRVETKLNANNQATDEMLDIIQSGKGFFKTMRFLGQIVKWTLGIATAIFAFLATLKSGGKL